MGAGENNAWIPTSIGDGEMQYGTYLETDKEGESEREKYIYIDREMQQVEEWDNKETSKQQKRGKEI